MPASSACRRSSRWRTAVPCSRTAHCRSRVELSTLRSAPPFPFFARASKGMPFCGTDGRAGRPPASPAGSHSSDHAQAGTCHVTAERDVGLDPSLNPHVTFDRSTANWSMSSTSRRIAYRSPHVEIARRRRQNYALLNEQLTGLSGAEPLYATLPNGACPLAFPLVVDEPESLLRELESAGSAPTTTGTSSIPHSPPTSSRRARI